MKFLQSKLRSVRAIAAGRPRNSVPWRLFGQPSGRRHRVYPNPCAYPCHLSAATAAKVRTLVLKTLRLDFKVGEKAVIYGVFKEARKALFQKCEPLRLSGPDGGGPMPGQKSLICIRDRARFCNLLGWVAR